MKQSYGVKGVTYLKYSVIDEKCEIPNKIETQENIIAFKLTTFKI